MKLRRFCVSTAVAAAISGSAAAHAEWLEAKSQHFTLVGDLPEATMRRRVMRLERFDSVLRAILPKAAESNLPVMIVPTAEDVRRVGHRPEGTLAYFSRSPYGVFAVAPAKISTDYGISVETIMFHEYAHHFLMGSLDDPMPRWMNEGMAELFMMTRLSDNGTITLGVPNGPRAYSLNDVNRWTAERLFDSDRRPPLSGEVPQLYAKGWLVLHYLLFSGRRNGEFERFTTALKQGGSQLEAARKAFGDLGKFESELELYRMRRSLPAMRLSNAMVPVSEAIAMRPLRSGEAEIMPFRVQSKAGVTPQQAVRLAAEARPVGARYPDDPFVQRALAEIEYDALNYAAADQAIDRALAADPGFVDGMAFKALLLGARARRDADPALWRQARSWIVKANRIEPDNVFALRLYFDSFIAAREKPNIAAVNGLMRAIVVQPVYQEVRVLVAVELIAGGDAARARAAGSDRFFAARSCGQCLRQTHRCNRRRCQWCGAKSEGHRT